MPDVAGLTDALLLAVAAREKDRATRASERLNNLRNAVSRPSKPRLSRARIKRETSRPTS